MRVLLVAVGRPRDAALASAIAEYESRAARYWPFEAIEVKEEPGRVLTPEQVKRREGERLVARCPAGAQVIACDVDGQRFDSERFADMLRTERDRARDVAFVIGGAHGLDDTVRTR